MISKAMKNLSVPDEKDCIFTKPDFESWRFLADENKSSLVGVAKRNISRSELFEIAVEYSHRLGFSVSQLNNGSDIIVTGHQPNWHHCGIFAKNFVTEKFARQISGTAIQLVLDHDICDTSISLPGGDNDGLVTISLEKEYRDIPLELRDSPCEEQLRGFIECVFKTSEGSFCCDIWQRELEYMFESSVLCRNLADLITLLQGRLNEACGFEIIYLPVSLMSEADSFIDFVCSIICDGVRFVGVYNRTIKDKRENENLKRSETLRSLKIDYLNDIVELPFWVVSEIGKKSSLYININEQNIGIGTVDKIIGTIDSFGDKKQQLIEVLRKNKSVIRPKAVTLTLFVRLYLADLFVHGVGAGNYEYITDSLISDYYGVAKTNFGIATATMTLRADDNYREFFFGLFPKRRLEKLMCSQRNLK